MTEQAEVGSADAFRVFDPLAPVKFEAAPAGYEWVLLPGHALSFAPSACDALACVRCGALVALYEQHNKWHGSTP